MKNNKRKEDLTSVLFNVYMAGYNHGKNEKGVIPNIGTFQAFQRLINGESPLNDGGSYPLVKNYIDNEV